jgi:hypothetical protein
MNGLSIYLASVAPCRNANIFVYACHMSNCHAVHFLGKKTEKLKQKNCHDVHNSDLVVGLGLYLPTCEGEKGFP